MSNKSESRQKVILINDSYCVNEKERKKSEGSWGFGFMKPYGTLLPEKNQPEYENQEQDEIRIITALMTP